MCFVLLHFERGRLSTQAFAFRSTMPFCKYGVVLVRRRWYRCLTGQPTVMGYCDEFDERTWNWLLIVCTLREGASGGYWDEVGAVP